MEYIRNTLDFLIQQPSVITLGKFDGLHRGHELLMERVLEEGQKNGYAAVVFTFDVPPKNRIEEQSGQILTTNEEKHYIFEQRGIDYLIECPFTEEIRCMTPEKFISWMVEKMNVKCVVIGRDFHFGHNREGDYRVLEEFENVYGYRTIVLEKMQEDERDISSTFIREEIAKGNIQKANHLLGYEFFMKSRVIHGNAIGRTMGFPTINMQIAPEKILPPFGVYVTRVVIGERWYKGVSNIGIKPTVEGEHPAGVETYILDFCQDIYEQEVVIQFLAYLRPEKKFSSLQELQQQIMDDIVRAGTMF